MAIHTQSLLWRNLGSRINRVHLMMLEEKKTVTADLRLPVKVPDSEEVGKTRKEISSPFKLAYFFGYLFFFTLSAAISWPQTFLLSGLIPHLCCDLSTSPFPPRHHLYLNSAPALQTPCIKTCAHNSLPNLSLTSWRLEEKMWGRTMRSRKFTAM